MHVGVNTKKIENLFFAIATVTTGVDSDGGEFASLAPALDGEDGDSKDVGDFTDGEEVREMA